jgi:hypothetical protein
MRRSRELRSGVLLYCLAGGPATSGVGAAYLRTRQNLMKLQQKDFVLMAAAGAPLPPRSDRRPRDAPEPIDRASTCPFLLRVFVSEKAHRKPEEYQSRDKLPERETQFHVWCVDVNQELVRVNWRCCGIAS